MQIVTELFDLTCGQLLSRFRIERDGQRREPIEAASGTVAVEPDRVVGDVAPTAGDRSDRTGEYYQGQASRG